MDFALTEDQKLLRDGIIRFTQAALNEDVVRRDRDQTFSRALWKKCGEIGIQGLPVPEEYGGSGVDALTCTIGLEALGYGCHDGGLVFALCAHLLSCVVPLWKFGSESQKRKYLPGLCNGTLVGVHAMSEPGSGSDAFALRTRAVADGDGFVINGTKTFISNAPEADLVIVFAVTTFAMDTISMSGYGLGGAVFKKRAEDSRFRRGFALAVGFLLLTAAALIAVES